jgi:hypothetical protein
VQYVAGKGTVANGVSVGPLTVGWVGARKTPPPADLNERAGWTRSGHDPRRDDRDPRGDIRDEDTNATARCTAIRTLREIEEKLPPAAGAFDDLDELAPRRRYRAKGR